jgi:chromosomal replication initiation ATPase DnaA
MKLNRDYTFQNYLVSDNKKDARKAISSAMVLPESMPFLVEIA